MTPSIKVSLSIASICILAACSDSGKNSTSAGIESQNEVAMSDGSNIHGHYVAELHPINFNLNFLKVGTSGVSREGDHFAAITYLKYGHNNTFHKQAIYTGRRCPTIADDLNKDAFIDMSEALAVIGEASIPLDSNLDSQEMGKNQYPTSDANGKYLYKGSASFQRMFSDLKLEDHNPHDYVMKLKSEEGLTFPGRVVLLQGITPSIRLPNTIGTPDGGSKHSSLPSACGILWKVSDMPDELKQ